MLGARRGQQGHGGSAVSCSTARAAHEHGFAVQGPQHVVTTSHPTTAPPVGGCREGSKAPGSAPGLCARVACTAAVSARGGRGRRSGAGRHRRRTRRRHLGRGRARRPEPTARPRAGRGLPDGWLSLGRPLVRVATVTGRLGPQAQGVHAVPHGGVGEHRGHVGGCRWRGRGGRGRAGRTRSRTASRGRPMPASAGRDRRAAR